MTAKEIIEKKIAKKLHENPQKAKEINAIIAIELSGDEKGRWVIDCTENPPKIYQDEKAPAQMTIKMKGGDFVKLANGEINPQMAFLTGKIKIDGDLGLAMKLGSLLT